MAIPGPANNSSKESKTVSRIEIRDNANPYSLFDLASVLNGCFIGVPLKGTPTVIGEFRGP